MAELEGVDGAARVDGNVTAFGVYVVDKDGKLIGGNGPPGFGGNWTTRPPATASRGWTSSPAARRRVRTRSLLDSNTAGEGGYVIGDKTSTS